MSERIANRTGFRAVPVVAFVGVFVTVFLLVFVTSTAITFVLPEVYASTARIKVANDAPPANGQPVADISDLVHTDLELIQSEAILKPVIDKLNLNTEWGRKYFNGEQLRTGETLEILKQRLKLAPVKNTMLIAITAYSDDRREAAHIANAIAESYRGYRLTGLQKLHAALVADPTPVIVDLAEPGHAPVKPNKPLDIALGAVLGFFLALAAGAGAAFLTRHGGWRKRKAT